METKKRFSLFSISDLKQNFLFSENFLFFFLSCREKNGEKERVKKSVGRVENFNFPCFPYFFEREEGRCFSPSAL